MSKLFWRAIKVTPVVVGASLLAATSAFAQAAPNAETNKSVDGVLNQIDRPRSGTPPTFTAQQVVRIIALACEDPQEAGVPITEWTPRELAQKASERGIVETISARTVERFLCMRLNFSPTVIAIG